ncbi:MAG TPA: type II secretion system protein GspK [Armatimonadota bacterium]|nr:type II secretion system protein GspK [Armatimonadota bacterium]HOS42163.1 type II secretion system protein GspK [Armatimonadota bacterium]
MRRRNRRGIALITALWMLAVLVILVAGFAAAVHSDTQAAGNFAQLTRARWAARAGLARAEAALISEMAQPYTALQAGRLLLEPAEADGAAAGMTVYRTLVDDEAGKINLNTASAETLAMLLPAEVVDAVLDWRDEDDTPGEQGAESDYYQTLTPPYRCRNAPFVTVRELLLVKGITRELLATRVTADGRTLEDLLTVSSSDTNTDAAGQPRVNLFTASKEELTEAFSEELTEEEIDAIIAQRGAAAFRSPADLLQMDGLSREKVAAIYDRVTTTTDRVRKGLVNINTAPKAVLMALPDMDEAAADAIVQRRETTGPYASLGELLDDEGMSVERFRQVAELLTTRSRVFTVRSTGQDADGVQATVTCVLGLEQNGSDWTTRTMYWRES